MTIETYVHLVAGIFISTMMLCLTVAVPYMLWQVAKSDRAR